MRALKAEVWDGQLTGEPAMLSRGIQMDLAQVDTEDELDEEERARLHDALREAWEGARAGQTISAEEFLRSLDAEE